MANEQTTISHPQTGSTSTEQGQQLLFEVTQPSKNKRLVWSAFSESESIPRTLSEECKKVFDLSEDSW